MAKQIDDETMENVCILAKLSLTEEEKEKAKKDMQEMLDYVDNQCPIFLATRMYFVRMKLQMVTTARQCLQMRQKPKKDSIRFQRP